MARLFKLEQVLSLYPCAEGLESGVISMCKVKTGAAVRTSADLQNLVTSSILRQPKPFTKSEIITQILKLLVNSPYASEKEQICDTCDHTIMFMELAGNIRSTADNHYRLTVSFPSYNRTWAGAR